MAAVETPPLACDWLEAQNGGGSDDSDWTARAGCSGLSRVPFVATPRAPFVGVALPILGNGAGFKNYPSL